MKKTILSLLAAVACMSMNAQVVKIYKNGGTEPVATYTQDASNTYKVVFEEKVTTATTGSAKATLSPSSIAETDVQWVQLWENGPKWALFNVGANSVGDYGGYYGWGCTTDRDSFGNYCTNNSDIQGGSNDTATLLWGSNWQMPKSSDYSDLLNSNKCSIGWTNNYDNTGLAGLVFTGLGEFSSNSVFFPAAGYCENGSVHDQGNNGLYWTSTPSGTTNQSYYLLFNSSSRNYWSTNRRNGCSVRAILK